MKQILREGKLRKLEFSIAKSTISKEKTYSLKDGKSLKLERTKKITWSSYKERKGNALALGADEGRD